MSAASNYLENALVNAVFRNTTYTSPATVYLALYVSNPADDDSGTEVSGTNYVRKAITFGAPSNGAITQSAQVTFDTAGAGGWGDVSHWGIFDASTDGNLLAYGAFSGTTTVNSGDTAFVGASAVVVTLA
jgi:hypothetical protein